MPFSLLKVVGAFSLPASTLQLAVQKMLLFALFLLLPPSLNTLSREWDWSRTRTWAEYNMGRMMTASEAEFVATHYDVVGLGGIFGAHLNTAEVVQAAAAAQLKSFNKKLKVIIYRNSDLDLGFAEKASLEFRRHPEWLLRSADGFPVDCPGGKDPRCEKMQGQLTWDPTIKAVRDWFINATIGAITNQTNGTAVDGVFVDGAGDEVDGRLTLSKSMFVNASHASMVGELNRRLHAIRPGMLTIGNGAVLALCGWDGRKEVKTPCTRNLNHLDSVCAEHFGSFESVDPVTGNFNGPIMEKWMTAVSEATAAGTAVFVKSWPGPFSMYNDTFTWKNFSDANITLTNMDKKRLGAAALDWSLAAYLLIAAPTTYMSYGWWYQLSTGYAPCPHDPASCACPDDWYPALLKPTGKPLGPRQRAPGGSGHVWTREFERVSVQVDLGNFSHVFIRWK